MKLRGDLMKLENRHSGYIQSEVNKKSDGALQIELDNVAVIEFEALEKEMYFMGGRH